MDVLKLAKKYEMMVFAASAQPGDIQKALGNLYRDDGPIYTAIDKHVASGGISLNAYMTVDSGGNVTLTLKSSHPKTARIQKELLPLARSMSATLKKKKILPAETIKVPPNKPWKENIGYK